ncbi:MAG: hypothetical protein ACD_73C00328G0002 [uncultured bacterium]|nr:MAG: hypothetical protein ACD_73C00328G0002 [uncultured bacterium]
MLSRLDSDLEFWTNIENIVLSFSVVTDSISEDVTADNFSDVAALASETLHPVIFDSDGSITESLYGQSSQYYLLGFAGFTTPAADDGVIESGLALFNCLCVGSNTTCPSDIDVSELDATIVHEMGHFIGLDHTAVNEDLVNSPCDTAVLGDCSTVPIMYPTTFDAFEPLAVQEDDKIATLALYGNDGWDASYCTVTGSLVDTDGNPLLCADVQAVSSDTADTVSFVSGYLALATDENNDGDAVDDGECTSDCGDFILRLQPATDYSITIKPLTETWISSSSVGPCKNEQLTGIIEEEISTVSGCTAGETIELGVVATQSTGGISSGDTTGESDGTTSTADCGEGQDFTHCDELVSCALNPMKVGNVRGVTRVISLMIFGAIVTVNYVKIRSRKQKTKNKTKSTD